jgi:hypothetical protein
MQTTTRIAGVFLIGLASSACGKSAVEEICLSDEGAYQDCGIACDVTKNEETCAKFAKITTKLCEDNGKAACQELCEGSNDKKNETACELAAKME